METERIALSQRELDRLRVLHEIKQKQITQREAASPRRSAIRYQSAGSPPSWQQFFNRAFAHETIQRPQSAERFFSEFQRAVS
jgi:hypothetical protein